MTLDFSRSIEDLHKIFNVLVSYLGVEHKQREEFVNGMQDQLQRLTQCAIEYKFPNGPLGPSGALYIHHDGDSELGYELHYEAKDHTKERHALKKFASELLRVRNWHNPDDAFLAPRALPLAPSIL